MSSNAKPLSLLEAIVVLSASIGLMLWYAMPQIFFSLYPVYELVRLIVLAIAPASAGG